MIEFLIFGVAASLLLLVLYAAFGRDERDNMQGHCRAAAMRALNRGDR